MIRSIGSFDVRRQRRAKALHWRGVLTCALLLWLFRPVGALAIVDVILRRPLEDFRIGALRAFVTNDAVLTLIGDVRSDGGELLLSIETPAGVPSLADVEMPLSRMTLDLGARESVGEIVLTPVILSDDGSIRSFGVRVLTASVSDDGRTYGEPIRLVSPSGVGSPDGKSHVRLPAPVSGRFLRLRWLDSWQRGPDGSPDVRLADVAVRGPADEPLPARIIRVGRFFSPARPIEPFMLSVLLKEGRNRVRVEAEQLDRPEEPVERRTDAASIDVTLMPEIAPPAEEEEPAPIVLSDGSNIAVTIPRAAMDETMRGLSLIRDDPAAIPPASYRKNRFIRAGSGPVLSYHFEGRFQMPFDAEATASLPGQPASLAVDGRFEYPSTWISSLAPFPIRWKVDLRKPVMLGRIVLHARVDSGTSFAPQRAKILVSEDDVTYTTALEVEDFEDAVTSLPLPTTPAARWVELVIEEGRQPNNIQINEIEFFDASGARILAEVTRPTLLFREPIQLALRFTADDLASAGVPDDAPMGVFLWNGQANEWQWTHTIPVPESRPRSGGLFLLELNVLSPLAVFPIVPPTETSALLTVEWSFNPFSPNGDGIADTTRLSIRTRPARYDDGAPTERDSTAPPEVTVHLFDMRGMLVQTLADRTPIPSRSLTIEWDGRDRSGRPVPIGPYIYEVRLMPNGSSRAISVYNGLLAVGR